MKLIKKMRAKRGFSLAELMIVLLIMSIASIAIAVGISSAAKVYKEIRASSEANVLCGTLATELSETLRFATDISQSGSDAVFTYPRFGKNVSISTRDGRIYVGDNPVLSDGAYMQLTAEASASYAASLFTLNIKVFDYDGDTVLSELTLTISPI